MQALLVNRHRSQKRSAPAREAASRATNAPASPDPNACHAHYHFISTSSRATDAQIHELVASVNGTITEGPTDVSAYTVRLTDDPGHPDQIAETAKKLRSHALVMLAEPALPPMVD